MFEKFADKFSKKAIENAKEAVVENVKENKVSYIMAGITGLVIAAGVIVTVKAIIGGISAPVPTYSITNNYYITIPKVPTVE